MPISGLEPVEGARANAYRACASLLKNGSTVLNLMIWNAAIYCTLVVQDIVIVGSAEPWLISHGENAIAAWGPNFVSRAGRISRAGRLLCELPFRCTKS